MKTLNPKVLSTVIATLVVASSVNLTPRHQTKASPTLAIGFAEAFAGTAPVNCDQYIQSAVAAAPTPGSYAQGVLDHFHQQLYRFNRLETADVEFIFCRLTRVLGIDPNLAQLPQTVTKTDPRGHQISVALTAPTETFATANGYVAKAEVSQDGTKFLTLWWAGNSDGSKGYLIQNDNPMVLDGMNRRRYVQWDRTGVSQTVKIWATQFASAYLTNVTGSTGTQTGGDRATFARATYNSTTKAILGQSVEIRAQNSSATTFSCIKTEFNGTVGGSIDAYRPEHGTPDSVSDTHTDGTHLDGISGVIDSPTTTSGGTPLLQPVTLPQALDYSCNDVDHADDSGKPFAGGQVDFTMNPSTIFP